MTKEQFARAVAKKVRIAVAPLRRGLLVVSTALTRSWAFSDMTDLIRVIDATGGGMAIILCRLITTVLAALGVQRLAV